MNEGNPATVAVFGSVHLDILSHVRSHPETLDRPGDLTITVGGTAHNVAINLRSLGHPVSFGTVLADTMLSGIIVNSMIGAGVAMHADLRKDLPEAGFSAHLHEGRMLSAVSSTPIENAEITRAHAARTLAGTELAVADCNMSVQALRTLRAEAAAKSIPLCLAGTSEAKAVKVLDLLGQGRAAKRAAAMDGRPLLALFLNDLEFDFLLKTMTRRNPRFGGSRRAALAELLAGVSHVVETCAQDGVRVWSGSPDAPAAEAKPEATPSLPDSFWVGAGDHLMAEALHAHLAGATICDAACAASSVVSRRFALSEGPSATGHLRGGNPIEERVRRLTDTAFTDALTGLANRSGLDEYAKSRNPAQTSGFLMFDLDHFKRINDTAGHDVGDLVLRRMGAILRSATREMDCACRWGGEELVVVLDLGEFEGQSKERRLAAAVGVAERVRSCVEETDFPCGQVTCSVGVSVGPLSSIDDMRERADKALYEAKHGGRNQVRTAAE